MNDLSIISDMDLQSTILKAKGAYSHFLHQTMIENGFRFTQRSPSNPYSNNFGIYGLHLLGELENLDLAKRNAFRESIIANVTKADLSFNKESRKILDKAFMQLLCFSLTSLSLLGGLEDERMQKVVDRLEVSDIDKLLLEMGAFQGLAQSGNKAMFLAIVLLYQKSYLGKNIDNELAQWVELHLKHMNNFGFWGDQKSIDFLQFQNGYHQYEILYYLNCVNSKMLGAAEYVATLADEKGHFAPYAGGGGCYDFDAIFILTFNKDLISDNISKILNKTVSSIISEQNVDGGFAENKYIRANRFNNLGYLIKRPWKLKGNNLAFKQSLLQTLNLQRSKHEKIWTHWDDQHRLWNESNTWDSWFRMLTIAKILKSQNACGNIAWGFASFPGVGYHR